MFGGGAMPPGMFDEELTLVLNKNHSLVSALLEAPGEDEESMTLHHLYDLAMLGHKPLSAEHMTAFVERSNKIMERVLRK